MFSEPHLEVVSPAAQPRESWDSSRSLHSHLGAVTGAGTALLHVSSVSHPEEKKQDSPELWQEMFGDPAVQVVPSHTGTLPRGRMWHKGNGVLPSPKSWCSENLQRLMTTLGNPLGTSGVPENASPFLQVGGSIVSASWVTLDPRAELWPSIPPAPQNLSASHCSGWKSPGASTHLIFQLLQKQG